MHTRSFTRSSAVHAALLAAASLVTVAAPARAQYSPARDPDRVAPAARQLFEWEGRVDREIQLVVRDGRLAVRRVGSNESSGGSSRVVNALPRRDGYLRVERVDGRGRVEVLEQPSARNDYTAVVRLADPSSGAGYYRVVAYWEPAGGVYGRDGTYDRNGNGRYEPGDHRGNSGRVYGPYDRRDRDDDDRDYRRRGSGNGALRWSGEVDRAVQIRLRDGQALVTSVSGRSPRNVSSSVRGGQLPEYARITLRVREGRGAVTVVEQPSAANGYTAVIRVSDPASGYGRYDFDVAWR
jgi:hypothetical protein